MVDEIMSKKNKTAKTSIFYSKRKSTWKTCKEP